MEIGWRFEGDLREIVGELGRSGGKGRRPPDLYSSTEESEGIRANQRQAAPTLSNSPLTNWWMSFSEHSSRFRLRSSSMRSSSPFSIFLLLFTSYLAKSACSTRARERGSSRQGVSWELSRERQPRAARAAPAAARTVSIGEQTARTTNGNQRRPSTATINGDHPWPRVHGDHPWPARPLLAPWRSRVRSRINLKQSQAIASRCSPLGAVAIRSNQKHSQALPRILKRSQESRALPSTPEHSRALPSTPEHSRALPSRLLSPWRRRSARAP